MDRNAAEREQVYAWGRLEPREHVIVSASFADEMVAAITAGDKRPLLCRGLGRSYGDVGLNGGHLLDTTRADHFLSADWTTGVIRAEAGLSLDALLRTCVPRGWFLPVSPGTKFVTLGGAVANDVHGKNHESAGTLGCHVRRIGLARSSGDILELSAEQEVALFAATIGGLGLTGVMLWIELQLVPIRSATMEVETLRMEDLEGFFRLSAESDWPYTVAWVDSLARGRALGRGLFIRGRHSEAGALPPHGAARLTVPHAARHLLNPATIALFNLFYRTRPWALGRATMHYDRFFYPLDSLSQWNRLYGRRGFFQHQSVVPMKNAPETVRKLLELTAECGEPSFLTVLKVLGDRPSPGVLSFPMPGVTLALDLANRGESTRQLLNRLADPVVAAGGRLYPAKDATMSGDAFRAGYPDWRRIEDTRDPAIMSDFWRRVTAGAR